MNDPEEELTILIMSLEQEIEDMEIEVFYYLDPERKQFFHAMNKELVEISNSTINNSIMLESKFRKIGNYFLANRFRIILERQNAILQIIKKYA